MDRGRLSSRIAALRMECAAVGRELADGGRGLAADEAFEVAGELQGLVNAAEGAQAVAAALGARVEVRLGGPGPVERVHPLGFVDPMSPSMVAMEAGVTEGLAGRKVRLGADLSERFPRILDLLVEGAVPASSAHKVLDATTGLDVDACARIDAELAPRLPSLDPARVMSEARRIAARVAADQVAARDAKAARSRCVEVRAGDDGLTEWSALLPTATSAAMLSAVESLAGQYRQVDGTLSVPESRADAFTDLVLRNVTVTAQVTLGVPVVTGGADPAPAQTVLDVVPRDPDETIVDAVTGEWVRIGDLPPETQAELSWYERDLHDDPSAFGAPMAQVTPGVAVSGTQLAGLGWVEAGTVAGILQTLPVDVARAVLDAATGTQIDHTSTAYTVPTKVARFVTVRDGTCRMWGCARPAERCDLDHVRPWPTGPTTPGNLVALCRRHHRMKQLGIWRPSLSQDGTLTWTNHTGTVRRTEPQHRGMSPATARDAPPF